MTKRTRRLPKIPSRKKGQTMVEYLLLTGAVALTVVAMKKVVMDGMFASVLPETVSEVQGMAASGGRRVGYYYTNSATTPGGP